MIELIQTTQVMAFESVGLKVGLFKAPIGGEYIVCDLFTGKAIFCLGWEQAHWIFDGCVNNIKRATGIGSGTNQFN